ncbi:MAG: hypothetical protein Kow00107_07390 [Planctomycetota bacterium]
MPDVRSCIRNRAAGLTLAELLLSLALLALGLSGILAAFPVGLRLAAQVKEDTLASIIFQNNAACLRFRGYSPYVDTTPILTTPNPQYIEWLNKYYPPTFQESSMDLHIPMNACDRDFLNVPFEVAINPLHGTETYLHDSTVGEDDWQVSIARRRSKTSHYSLILIVVHRRGSDKTYSFMMGKGYDFNRLLEEDEGDEQQ